MIISLLGSNPCLVPGHIARSGLTSRLSHLLTDNDFATRLCWSARRGSLPRASGKYRRLNELALGVVRPGGVLMTCSCSGAMTQSGGLGKVVQEAAMAAERQVRRQITVTGGLGGGEGQALAKV